LGLFQAAQRTRTLDLAVVGEQGGRTRHCRSCQRQHDRARAQTQLSNTDRFLFVWLYRWFPSVLSAIAILRPETIIRWHRAGFRSYWRERSRRPVGRPRISAELRNLIGAMSHANRLWGAPHIHGELLKLGFTIEI